PARPRSAARRHRPRKPRPRIPPAIAPARRSRAARGARPRRGLAEPHGAGAYDGRDDEDARGAQEDGAARRPGQIALHRPAHAGASRNGTAPARMTVVPTRMHAAHRMIAPPDGTGRSSSIGTSTRAMQLTVANAMLRNRKPRNDVTTLRAAAAGISNSAATSTA